ncbi:MAG: FAD-dependent oxidoreductase [Thermodesulfobacteriota bacterium]
MKELKEERVLLGNEAIARGIIESGCQFFAAYPGTPSSEILPAVVRFKKENNLDIYVEWSTNEKVAFENALVASYTGKRAAVAMKQVGLNVATDPLMSAAYIGNIGGFVIISCDDPGPYSSQTEQDSRFMAMFAKVPVFDPASPREAQQMLPIAFEVSEKYQIPVILRPVLRVSHAQQKITFNPIRRTERKASFIHNPQRWSATPRFRFILHRQLNQKLKHIAEEFNSMDILNFVENDQEKAVFGIIASGIGYAIARDVLFELGVEKRIPILKIGTPFPLPIEQVESFIEKCDQVLILEETEPVIEMQIRDKSKVHGRLDGLIPNEGEMLPEVVTQVISDFCRRLSIPIEEIPSGNSIEKLVADLGLPIRRPTLCSGCPHRASFYAIKKAFPNGIFPSDIGCYTLGMNLEAVDTCHDMGAAITFASGLYHAYHQDGKEVPIIATIGDSTFYHSGSPGLINAVYNGSRFILVILDNSIVAMTGMQPTPESGVTADGHPGRPLSIEELVKGCGVHYVQVVNPYDIKGMIRELRKAYRYTKTPEGGVAVLIARYPCITYKKEQLKVRPIKVEIRHTPPLDKDLPPLLKSKELPKELLPLQKEKIPPCQGACPLQVDARGYIELIAKGRFEEALALVREKNPFPAITGRLCSRPCEKVCRRGDKDQPIAIDLLKRFLADREEQMFCPIPGEEKNERVAIIGSGPSGLMAAYDLRMKGYHVTIFESLPIFGGTLAIATPRFRLPEEVMKKELEVIHRIGAEIRVNTTIGKDVALNDLREQGYQAVLLAIGAHLAKSDLPNFHAEGVIDSLHFLKGVALGKILYVPSRVLVLGGTERDINAARTALRLGAKEVHLFYGRSEREIPVDSSELEEAEREGVFFHFFSLPTAIRTSNGKAVGISFKRTILSEPSSLGRRRIVSIEGPEKRMRGDFIITSPTYLPDLSNFDSSLERSLLGTIRVDSETLATSIEGVFASGDAVTGPRNFIEGLAMGRKAALSIHRYLRGESLTKDRKEEGILTELVSVDISQVEPKPRIYEPLLSVEDSLKTFNEVHLLPEEKEIIKEAERCLHCGACYQCDLCLWLCPEGAISKNEGGYQIDYEKCTGCRLCVESCPTSTLEMPAIGACIGCGVCLKRFECPSLIRGADGRVRIDRLTCVDCGLCIEVCGQKAIIAVQINPSS